LSISCVCACVCVCVCVCVCAYTSFQYQSFATLYTGDPRTYYYQTTHLIQHTLTHTHTHTHTHTNKHSHTQSHTQISNLCLCANIAPQCHSWCLKETATHR